MACDVITALATFQASMRFGNLNETKLLRGSTGEQQITGRKK
jgi:hypothetical protein